LLLLLLLLLWWLLLFVVARCVYVHSRRLRGAVVPPPLRTKERLRPRVVQRCAAFVVFIIVVAVPRRRWTTGAVREDPRRRIGDPGEAVEEAGEDEEHGKEHGHPGHRRLAPVEPESASATSHEVGRVSWPAARRETLTPLPSLRFLHSSHF